MKSILCRLLVYALVLVSLSACHSSKKTVKPSSSSVGGAVVSGPDKYRSVNDVPWLENDGSLTAAVIDEAFSWLGTPYRYGGNTRSGIDCSGLLVNVFGKVAGVKIPRSSAEQQKYCRTLKRKDARPGDLVFFSNRSHGGKVGHVGLYIGNDRFIHASSSRGVIVSDLNQKYYADHYHSAGRVEAFAVMIKDGQKNSKIPKPVPEPIVEPSVAPEILQDSVSVVMPAPEIYNEPETVPLPVAEPEPAVILNPVAEPAPVALPEIRQEPDSAKSDSIRNEVRRAMRVSF